MARLVCKVILVPESPVAVLRTRASAQFVKTLDYLPGSVIRGAIAQVFINKRGADDADFQRIFVEEQIRFSDFLPAFEDQPSQLLPLSARACKRYGLSHGSSLADQLLNQILNGKYPAKKECPECREPLDRTGGYVPEGDSVESVSPGRQLRMHVGISRQTGSALHGLLFSYEMLTEEKTVTTDKRQQLRFTGFLSADEAHANEVFEILQQVVPQREHLSAGKARTRGLGELTIDSFEQGDPQDDFQQRWKAFNDKVHGNGGDPEKCYFSITLNSHLSLKDDLGRPVLGNVTPAHFNLPEAVECYTTFVSAEVVAGWNAAQGLPKADTHALSRGSVFAFSAPKSLESQLQTQLQTLETEGLGERRAEGFGQLTVCHKFHVEKAGKE